MDNRSKKIVEFYISELLNHAKSMSEHRFSPLEFSIVKKILLSITQSQDISAQIRLLEPVTTLKSFTSFLLGNIQKLESSGFKMSQLISILESDSDKILQILLKPLSSDESLTLMEKELSALGLELDLAYLKKNYEKKQPEMPMPAVSKSSAPEVRKPETVVIPKTVAEHKPVAPPVVEEKKIPKLPPDTFARVDDMLGFLSKRGKKSPETVTSDKKTEPAGTVRKSPSDILSAAIQALEQMQKNPGRTRHIINLADAIGRLGKWALQENLNGASSGLGRFEYALNAIADNPESSRTGLSTDAISILQDVVTRLGACETDSDKTLSEAINIKFEEFTKYLAKQTTQSTVVASTEAIPVPGGKSSYADHSHVSTEDWQVFREDALFQIDILQSGLNRLKKSLLDTEAVKDLMQGYRALATSARLLKLNEFHSHFDNHFKIYKHLSFSHDPVLPDLIAVTDRSVRVFSDLFQDKVVTKNDWEGLNSSMALFTNYEAAIGRSRVAEKPAVVPSEPVVELKPVVAKAPDSILGQNENWIEEFQQVVAQFSESPLASVYEARRAEAAVKKAQEPAVTKKETVVETAAPAEVPKTLVISETLPSKVPVPPKSAVSEESAGKEAGIQIPDFLLQLMSTSDTDADLDSLPMPTFQERMNLEPKDIVMGLKSIRKKKTAAQEKPKPVQEKQTLKEALKAMPQSPIAEKTEKSAAAIIEGRLLFEETAFGAVDPEILDIFTQEATEYFKKFDQALGRLTENLKDDGAVKDIERVSHSLKSSARMLGFDRISGLAASIELITERCAENELTFDTALLGLLTETVKVIQLVADRKSADVTGIVIELFSLEGRLGAPNIFTGNIPGASTLAKQTGIETKQPEPKPEPRTAVVPEAKPAVKEEVVKKPDENYFAKLGIDEEIVGIFKEEVASYFKLITNALTHLRKDMDHSQSIKDIEKAAHSLRSSAKMLGFQKISNLVKPMESVAERMNRGEIKIDAQVIALYEQSTDRLKLLSAGQDTEVDEVINALTVYETSEGLPAAVSPAAKDESVIRIDASPPVPKKKVKAHAAAFDDVPMESDSILKNLFKGASLLDEMSDASHPESR